MGIKDEPVAVTGIWLRRTGNRTQVLAEVGGKMRLVIEEPFDSAFSHIVESAGILAAPLDKP